MANRYFIQRENPNGWEELNTRPLYSRAAADGFIAVIRNAPKGDWATANLRIMLNGQPIEGSK